MPSSHVKCRRNTDGGIRHRFQVPGSDLSRRHRPLHPRTGGRRSPRAARHRTDHPRRAPSRQPAARAPGRRGGGGPYGISNRRQHPAHAAAHGRLHLAPHRAVRPSGPLQRRLPAPGCRPQRSGILSAGASRPPGLLRVQGDPAEPDGGATDSGGRAGGADSVRATDEAAARTGCGGVVAPVCADGPGAADGPAGAGRPGRRPVASEPTGVLFANRFRHHLQGGDHGPYPGITVGPAPHPGRQGARPRGREQGLEKGREEGLRESIRDVLEIRFAMGATHPLADRLAAIGDRHRLKQLHRAAIQVDSLEEFRRLAEAGE